MRLNFCVGGGGDTRGGQHEVSARFVIIGTGTIPKRDDRIPFDGRRIFQSDDILTMEKLPRTMTVVGAGVIGLEYASIFAALGVRVTLIDKRPKLLTFVDGEIILYTPEAYYASSYEGAHFVQLRFPGLPGLYSFHQFASVLNRPDIIEARLAGASDAPPPRLVPPPVVEARLVEDAGVGGRVKIEAHSS